ncbi:MAG TPA: multiheme c-type cytochrome [Acidobacteriaceae bacterium]|nr:multiheme c-type cytochrome [Acidobacteriaceae bacterium]
MFCSLSKFAQALLVLTLATVAYASAIDTVRQADHACARCHQTIYQNYIETTMANASGLAIDVAVPRAFTQASSGITYQVKIENGNVLLTYKRAGGPSLSGHYSLEYFFGSGRQGRSFIYSQDHYLFEAPLSYYSAKSTYDLRPGYLQAKELPSALPLNSQCLICHMSGVQREDSGTVNRYSGFPFLHGGITCEACHGDTSAHVLHHGKGRLLEMSKLGPLERDSICLRCHLESETSVARRGRSLSDFKPGDRLSDDVSYFVHTGEQGSTGRAVSQVEALAKSECKRRSGERMSCTTCHDPHSTPAPSERVLYYRSKCLGCHTQPRFASSHYRRIPDCTSCHMPKSPTSDIPHAQVTDHRILRIEGEHAGEAEAPIHEGTLIPVSGIGERPSIRSFGLAFYRLGLSGDPDAIKNSWDLLQKALQADPNDSEVLSALGFIAQMRGDVTQSEEFLEKAYKLNPTNVYVANDVGVLLASSGKLNQAANVWTDLFARNQDLVDLGDNLALLQCRLGRKPVAIETLQRVLHFSPDHRPTQDLLSRIQLGDKQCISIHASKGESSSANGKQVK